MSGVYISESKRYYNVQPLVCYFYVKTKMLANFQICISVPLMCLISNGSWQYYFVLFDKLNVHLCINHFLLKKGFRPKYFIFYQVGPYSIPPLTLFRMGFFGAAHGWEGGQKVPPSKICHTYPTLMKLGTVTRYLKKIQKIHKSRDTPSEFCWHWHFSPEISNFCYIRKYRYRLHFNA